MKKANDQTQIPRLDPPLILLLISAFLAPIFGGYTLTDQSTIKSGFMVALVDAFSGVDSPVLTHWLLALPIFIGIIWVVAKRRVQQVPKQLFSSGWAVFFMFLGFSIIYSAYRMLSLTLWLEWLCYGCALFAAVAIGGRRLGPLLIAAAIAAGSAIVAINGIREYQEHRAFNASWRIFAGWINPNATAALLCLGFFVALGLCLSQKRLGSLGAGAAAILCFFALVLTGSKGGVSLAFPVGLIGFGVCQVRGRTAFIAAMGVGVVLCFVIGGLFVKNVGWVGLGLGSVFMLGVLFVGAQDKNAAIRASTVLVLAVLMVVGLGMKLQADAAAKGGPGVPTPIARVGNGAQTQEQSSVFRLNLWKSAGYLIKEKPTTGYGLGTYRYESGRAGIATTTVLAHNAYLQLWAEAGFVPFVLFLLGVGYWIFSVLRDRQTLPAPNLYLLSGVFAAVVTILAHSLIDSDLYYFGIGLPFFLLMGIGLSLSSDSVAPELVHRPIRAFAIGGTTFVVVFLLLAAVADNAKSVVRNDVRSGDAQAVKADVDGIGWLEPFDGEANYLNSIIQPPDQSVQTLKQAYDLEPSDRVARALAKAYQTVGKNGEAENTLKDALTRDPNNFSDLTLMIQLQQASGDTEGAIETANRLVAVEDTPYFKVRSIPESIPTETYDARIQVLAPAAKSDKEKADLLAAAVRGYLAYADMKMAVLKPNAAESGNDPNFRIPGYDSIATANQKLTAASTAATAAAQLYGKLGDSKSQAEMVADAAKLSKVAAA